MPSWFAPLVLCLVMVLIAVRRIGRFRFSIWEVMVGGAVLVLATGTISMDAALAAIDLEVIAFLAGMFVLGEALDRSGMLAAAEIRLFSRIGSPQRLMLAVVFVMGGLSALAG